jgi:hypothetical protein
MKTSLGLIKGVRAYEAIFLGSLGLWQSILLGTGSTFILKIHDNNLSDFAFHKCMHKNKDN